MSSQSKILLDVGLGGGERGGGGGGGEGEGGQATI
jgi:hypothetical protein